MNIIETIAPIPIEELKIYFNDKNTSYLINYENSKLKGNKLLTYLSNLDLPCDIEFGENEESKYELLKEYFHSQFLVNIPNLEYIASCVLHDYKGITNNGYSNFIKDNEEIVKHWCEVLDSLLLFNSYTLNIEEMKTYVESFPVNDTDSVEGINFVSLLKNPGFFMYYQNVNKKKMSFYTVYFKENIFKGKNLYHFWANSNNPLFLLTMGIAEGFVTGENYSDVIKNTNKEIESVTSL